MAQRLAILVLTILSALINAPPVTAAPTPAPPAQTSPCVTAALTAIAQRGKQYVWGAKGPNAFDCSGLTQFAWLAAGINIGPSTYDQATRGVGIPCRLSDLNGASTTCWQPGDLIFLRYAGGQHVAMYVGDGLFVDAYNISTGVIIHNPAQDSFYQANFWQARRILECDGPTVTVPPADMTTRVNPALESLPDILSPVFYRVPQCNDCDPNGVPVLPAQEWSGSWPSGFELLNLAVVFQTVISWLAWQVSEIARNLLCWLLAMLQMLATFLLGAANMLIYGVNALLKMAVLIWLSLRAWFFAAWSMFESMRELLWLLGAGLEGLQAFGQLILDVLLLIIGLIGRIIVLLGMLAMAIIGIVGWIGGFVLGFWIALQAAMTGTTVPVQLSDTHIIYRGTRGVLEGVIASDIGWTLYVLWGMAYVAFVTWLARFLSVGAAGRGESS